MGEDYQYRLAYAPTSRASCKACRGTIAESSLRLGVLTTFMEGDTGYSWRHWRCVSGRTISNLNTHSEDVGGWYDLSAEDQTKVMADLERGWQLGKTEGVGKKRVEAWEKDDTKDVSWKVKMVESGAVVPDGWRKLKGSTPEAGKGAEEGGDGEAEKAKGEAKGKAKEDKAKEGKASAKEVTVIDLVDEDETSADVGKGKGKGKKAEKKKEEKKEEEKPKPKPRKKKEVVEAVPKVEEKKPATRMTRNSRRAAEEAEAIEKAAKESEEAEEAMQKLSM